MSNKRLIFLLVIKSELFIWSHVHRFCNCFAHCNAGHARELIIAAELIYGFIIGSN